MLASNILCQVGTSNVFDIQHIDIGPDISHSKCLSLLKDNN